VTGTIVNVVAIVLGSLAGMTLRRGIPPAVQNWLKVALGLLTVYFGMRLSWISVNGSALQILKQMTIVILAMMLGRLTGRLMRIQKASNRVGQYARERCAAARPGAPRQFNDAFAVCALLFCVAPLGPLGALVDGLGGYYWPLLLKAVMDALAAMGFVSLFGRGVILSALPVLAFQGTLSLVCFRYAEPFLRMQGLADSVNATAGLLIFSVAVLMLEIRRIEVADYFPSLIYAPLLTWLSR
jgi:hypothetical protein